MVKIVTKHINSPKHGFEKGCLYISDMGCIVLADGINEDKSHDNFSATCIDPGNTDWYPGMYSETWAGHCFKPFYGSVTLSFK